MTDCLWTTLPITVSMPNLNGVLWCQRNLAYPLALKAQHRALVTGPTHHLDFNRPRKREPRRSSDQNRPFQSLHIWQCTQSTAHQSETIWRSLLCFCLRDCVYFKNMCSCLISLDVHYYNTRCCHVIFISMWNNLFGCCFLTSVLGQNSWKKWNNVNIW